MVVHGEEAPQLVPQKDPVGLSVGPVGDAAALVHVHPLATVELGIELPELPAGFRIERQEAMKDGGDVEDAVHHQGRGLEGGEGGQLGAVAEVLPCRRSRPPSGG